MKEKIKIKEKFKLQGILSSLVILLPAGAGWLLRHRLPEIVATHWNLQGVADGWSSVEWILFGMPLLLLAIHWICLWVTFHDPEHQEQSPKVFRMIFWIMPCLSLFLFAMIYTTALQSGSPAERQTGIQMKISMEMLLPIIMGLVFLVIGNYMPKCKRNYTIGVKLPWTFSSEENWNHTHRFTGKVWVTGGILLILSSLAVMWEENWLVWDFPVILLMVLLPCVYSFLYYKKERKEGRVAGLKDPSFPGYSEKSVRLSVGIGIVILAAALLVTFQGSYQILLQEDYLEIDALFWEDAEISYDTIDSLEYRTEDRPGKRTMGYGTPLLLMGNFRNEEFGAYTRYTYTSCAACIVLTVDGKVMVLNAEEEKATEELYQELSDRCRSFNVS